MDITHDPAQSRFTATLTDGSGELRYRFDPDGAMNLYHTEVDPALQGRGVAGELAAAAFAFARDGGQKVRVTCPFVTSWLAHHPEERDIVV
jgi:uncharacterized protein